MSQSMLAYGLLAIAIVSEVTGSTFWQNQRGLANPCPLSPP